MKNRGLRVAVLFACLVVSIGGIAAFVIELNFAKQKAVQLADKYLENKYESEMVLTDVHFELFDASVYRVSYYPKNNPEIVFDVIVQGFMYVEHDNIVNDKEGYFADNYYLRYFEHFMEEYLADDVARSFGEKTVLSVKENTQGLHSYCMHPLLTDNLNIDDMEALINGYDIEINLSAYRVATEIAEDISNSLYGFIFYLQSSGFEPSAITIIFEAENGKRRQVLFGEISQITDPEQVRFALEDAEIFKN